MRWALEVAFLLIYSFILLAGCGVLVDAASRDPKTFFVSVAGTLLIVGGLIAYLWQRDVRLETEAKRRRDEEGHRIWLKANKPEAEAKVE